MKTCVIIEARMNSSRLPGKMLKTVLGKPVLELMIERVRRATKIDDVIVATTNTSLDDQLVNLVESLGINYYRGSENDVLVRVLETAREYNIDVIVEIPGDCPLIDPYYIDVCIDEYFNKNVDYVSSILSNTFPQGTEVQVFSREILEDVAKRTNDPVDHEHVSLYIYNNPEIYSLHAIKAPQHLCGKNIKLPLDTEDDFELIREIYEKNYTQNPEFGLSEILEKM